MALTKNAEGRQQRRAKGAWVLSIALVIATNLHAYSQQFLANHGIEVHDYSRLKLPSSSFISITSFQQPVLVLIDQITGQYNAVDIQPMGNHYILNLENRGSFIIPEQIPHGSIPSTYLYWSSQPISPQGQTLLPLPPCKWHHSLRPHPLHLSPITPLVPVAPLLALAPPEYNQHPESSENKLQDELEKQKQQNKKQSKTIKNQNQNQQKEEQDTITKYQKQQSEEQNKTIVELRRLLDSASNQLAESTHH